MEIFRLEYPNKQSPHHQLQSQSTKLYFSEMSSPKITLQFLLGQN
jgi:hypothetical protein